MPKVKGGIGPNQRLRDERLRRGWSQQEVADLIGTTANNVSRWELGTTSPDPFFRAKLCDLFGLPAAELGLPPTKAFSTHLPSLQTASVIPVPHLKKAEGTFKETNNTGGKAIYDSAVPVVGRRALFGRASLLQRLQHILCETGPSTMLALHGLPGVGKTALATELAHNAAIRDYFPDGILWAALGTSPHSIRVLSRWGTILGISTAQAELLTDTAAWTQAIRSLIDARRVLIILDDAWQSQDIQPFLVGGPHCAYLITTRHPEVATRFAHNRVVLVEELSLDDGVRLLVELAPEMLASDQQILLDLVQAVGGLPLALVLMGNHLRVHTYSRQPGRMLRAIATLRNPEERLKLAQPGDPFDSPSTRSSSVVSLQTVIGVSDYALNKHNRQSLHALACLPPKPNTFSEEAALAIADIEGETLDTLCDSGLLESRGSGRYTLHQTIVDYARTQGTHLQAEKRIVAYFLAMVQSENKNGEQLERESENILAAFQLACQHKNWHGLVRGITAFAPFLASRGMYPIVKPYLLKARLALVQPHNASTADSASVYFHLGRIADFQGAYHEADELYATGWEYVQSSGDEELMVLLLAYWGEMLSNAGRYQRGEQVLLEGLQLSQALGYKQQACIFLKNLGEVAVSLGNYAQATSYHQQGLALARELEYWELVSILLQNLAAHQAWHGNFQQAEVSYRESLTYARNIGHLQRCSAALSGLGFALLRQQRFSEAETYLQESLTLARKIRSPVRTGCVLQNLGILKSEQGNYAAAEAFLQESLDVATAIGHTWLMSETLYYRGELLLKQQHIQEAQTVFEQASQQAREQKEQELIALTAFGLARVLWKRGEARQAEAFAEESLALFRKMEHEQAERVAAWLQGMH
ncbi:MAG TPA: tetratricopeptide repeat protein [Ktedonobacteraceae bacterium]|nr:tetratricopeptide repeat protein [Ktedonobacteraceae bacterium]